MRLRDEIIAGMIGGLAGGLVMSPVMVVGKATGMIEEPLPLKFERDQEERLGVAQQTDPGQEQALALGEHLLFSAALGAGYGALYGSLGLRPLPAGPLYGLGIYALTLGTAGPSLGVTPGPWNQEPLTVGRQLMMHVVYGAVTALVAERTGEAMAL